MNYIVLNGKKSTSIQGLLISSLPPISKPLIRTQIEEIDGRDGDIVTKLGYAAYDKEIEIGLYGNYDVDEVISYFDSAGTVIFSNEPDKYYNYEIIEQIDFERLIRFKTATVTFHVQPFKYSAVESTLLKKLQLLNLNDYTETKNGVTLAASGDSVAITGTATAATEFYVPISALSLKSGDYTLTATASGTSPTSVAIRLIHDSPSNANSFGGQYVYLQDGSVTIEAELEEQKSYNYLWVYVLANVAIDITFTVSLMNDANSLTITNNGNTIAKPIVTITGSGIINLSIDGLQIFVIDLSNDDYITIDAAQMEAYANGALKNRLVTGDYDNFVLKVGKNTISWTGNISMIEFEKYSRWI